MFKVRTHNAIAVRGLERLPRDQFEVGTEIADPDALLLRSHKLAASDLGPSLRAIARAGAGVNNVPVDACSEAGIVVFNTPGANANSVKELVLAALLLTARDISGGIAYSRSLSGLSDAGELNRLVEAEKKRFKGFELMGKTLGVVGLGAIGSMVARAALDLGMDVLGYDPAISVDAAWRLPAEVQRMENLPSLFSRSDFVTLHVPLLPQTTGMINEEALRAFRPGSTLLNFAREPIVDADALKAALASDHLGRYVADFPIADLLDDSRVMFTPHLGASTEEAEENCAVMAAEQLKDFLLTGNIRNSVNFPPVMLEPSEGVRLAITNRNEPGLIGQITSVLADQKLNVVDMLNKSRGDFAYNLIDVEQPASELVLDALSQIPSVINVRVLG
ncbi:MAG: phosphoglycerate dehydrogenase [Pseudomonadaceae bacterium]|nr:phosphoglycerate dehydrogenase [Pseudomonadaceae bacterium]